MKKCLFVVLSFTLLSSLFNLSRSANAFEQVRIAAEVSEVAVSQTEFGTRIAIQPPAAEDKEDTELHVVANNTVTFNGTLAPARMVAQTSMTVQVPEYRIAGSGEEGDGVADDMTEEGHAPLPHPSFEGREPTPGIPVGSASIPTVSHEGIVPAGTGRVIDRDNDDSAEVTNLADAGNVTAIDDPSLEEDSGLEVRGNSLIGGCSLQTQAANTPIFQTLAFLVILSAPVFLRKKLVSSH